MAEKASKKLSFKHLVWKREEKVAKFIPMAFAYRSICYVFYV
jgi:hypothetical protein